MSCQERFKQQAIDILEALRNDNGMYGNIETIQRYLRKNESAPEDIGTSDQELKELENRLYFLMAKETLEKARKNRTTDPQDFHSIERFLEQAGLTLNDIGTNEQEILVLRKKWHLKQIADRLQRMHTKPVCKNPTNVRHILDDMRNGPCTFEEIGITEQELHELGNPTSPQS